MKRRLLTFGSDRELLWVRLYTDEIQGTSPALIVGDGELSSEVGARK